VSGTQAFSLKFEHNWGGDRKFRFGFKCHLHPVDTNQNELSRVYFNNTLVQGYNFTNKTALKTTLSLPVTQLLRTNNLEILFHTRSEENSQAGTTGYCPGSWDSYLTWSGYQGQGQLSDLPHVFLQPGQLIVDTRQALCCYSLFPGSCQPSWSATSFPQLVASQSIKDWSSLQDQSNKPPNWLLAIPPRATFPSQCVLIKVFLKPRSIKRLLKAQPTDPFGILQYFSYKGPTVCSLGGAGSKMAETLGQALTLAPLWQVSLMEMYYSNRLRASANLGSRQSHTPGYLPRGKKLANCSATL